MIKTSKTEETAADCPNWLPRLVRRLSFWAWRDVLACDTTAPDTIGWRPIETLDKSKSHVVLVSELGAMRLHVWNSLRQKWEHLHPIGATVGHSDYCANPDQYFVIPKPQYPSGNSPEMEAQLIRDRYGMTRREKDYAERKGIGMSNNGN